MYFVHSLTYALNLNFSTNLDEATDPKGVKMVRVKM